MTFLLVAVLLWTSTSEAAVVSGIVMLLGMGYVFWSGQRGREVHGAASNETPIQDVQERNI